MAGRHNQRRLAALQRLRDRLHGQDGAIRAWEQSAVAIRATESEMEALMADFEAKLAVIQAKRAQALRRSAARLAAVAVLVGDDNETARLLSVPLRQVRNARRCAAASRVGEPPGAVGDVETSMDR